MVDGRCLPSKMETAQSGRSLKTCKETETSLVGGAELAGPELREGTPSVWITVPGVSEPSFNFAHLVDRNLVYGGQASSIVR